MELRVEEHSRSDWRIRVPFKYNSWENDIWTLTKLERACENAIFCSAASLALGFLVMKREPTKEELSRLTKIFKEEGETCF